MARCCCTPQINDAANRVIGALSRTRQVIPQQLPPKIGLDFAVDDIARRVADYLNPVDDRFEQDVLRQLEAITSALVLLKSRPDLTDKLNQILRNQNDLFDLQVQSRKDNQQNFDKLATREQARDLLFAITDLRRTMIAAFAVVARDAALALTAMLAAIAAFFLAAKIAVTAEILAKNAQTAIILKAIAAIKIPKQETDLKEVNRKLDKIDRAQLSLDGFDTAVPFCETLPNGTLTIGSTPITAYSLKDKNGRNTESYQLSVANMLFDLLAFGELQCSAAPQTGEEILAVIDSNAPGSEIPRVLFANSLSPRYFTIDLTAIDPAVIRTYKLGGNQSEYGAGNWCITDVGERAVGEFTRISTRSQRLLVPSGLALAGIRVSLKPGVSAVVRAFGIPNQ